MFERNFGKTSECIKYIKIRNRKELFTGVSDNSHPKRLHAIHVKIYMMGLFFSNVKA